MLFGLVRPATVDGVLGRVLAGISDLRAVGEDRAAACTRKNEIAKDIQRSADEDAAEADRAFALAARFEALLKV
jgi:hypothetical protein